MWTIPTCFSKASHVAEMSRHFTVRNHVSHFPLVGISRFPVLFHFSLVETHVDDEPKEGEKPTQQLGGVYTKVGPYHL